ITSPPPMEKTPLEGGVLSLSSLGRVSVPDSRPGALYLRHDLRDEVVLLLLDARADLEALESEDLGLGTAQQLLDRGVGILHERLAREGDLAQGLAQASLDHLSDDLGGLALIPRLLGEDGALLLHDLRGYLRRAEVTRVARRDVHRNIVREGG